MKNNKKLISVVLVMTMLITVVSVVFSASAATETLASYYSTNPGGKFGVNKTITVDGNISDWDSSMIIAQGTANDDPRVYRPNSMYEVPIDLYTLYGAYDDNNLYLMWEMTNVQDVVAPNDDYPLSQGILYQTQNLPFFLAIDTGKSDAIGNNGQLSTGGTIWDSGISIQNSFNRLVAFSTNGSNGPFIYGGSSAGVNAKEIYSYATTGITLKWGLGIKSQNVYGINGGYGHYNNRLLGDMCNESADWVDFNTKGHKSSTMDFHYEMSIPLDKLGVTKSDISSNGVGVLLVSTFGKSAMDCLPYDLSMNDNADQADTESQEFNSLEKSDKDFITTSFARIGAQGGSVTPQPTTQPTPQPTTQPATQPTTQPTPQPTTQAPVSGDKLTVNATSNLFTTKSLSDLSVGDTVTIKYDLASTMQVVNGQWALSYDTSKLKLVSSTSEMAPVTGGTINEKNNNVYGNFTNAQNLYDFTTAKTFVQAEFEVLQAGSANVNLNVEELTVGYLSGGVLKYAQAVEDSIVKDLSRVSGFTSSRLTASADVTSESIADTLTVVANSNFFSGATATFDNIPKQVTVSFKFSSNFKVMNGQWVLKYDSTKLQLATDNLASLTPKMASPDAMEGSAGTVAGNFTQLNLIDFTTEDDFIRIPFNVIGTGVADVNLTVKKLGVAYMKNDEAVEAYVVDNSVVKDITNLPGFTNFRYRTNTVINAGSLEYILGDVNRNGRIDIEDATLIQQYVAEMITFDSYQMIVADTNKDGIISIKDVTEIQRHLAEYIVLK